MANYYEILGVERNATPGEIKSAYRDLAKKHHPDAVEQDGNSTFQAIHEAYSILIDPIRRKNHDREISSRKSSSRYHPVYRRRSYSPVMPLQSAPTHNHWVADTRIHSEERAHEVELRLDPSEARSGGTLVFEIQDNGRSSVPRHVPIHIPPGIRDDSLIIEPLGNFGMRGHVLRIRVRVR